MTWPLWNICERKISEYCSRNVCAVLKYHFWTCSLESVIHKKCISVFDFSTFSKVGIFRIYHNEKVDVSWSWHFNTWPFYSLLRSHPTLLPIPVILLLFYHSMAIQLSSLCSKKSMTQTTHIWTPISWTNFHGPKDVQAIEIWLYILLYKCQNLSEEG